MGLDMYWFSSGTAEEKTEALLSGKEIQKELGYFRKFHELNEFMGTFYPENLQGDFNTVALPITTEILQAMQDYTEECSPEDREKLVNICHNISAALDDGEEVVYWPWW